MSFKLFLGIDPGLTGGCVLLNRGGEHVSHMIMGPLSDFLNYLKEINRPDLFVSIEKAQAMPKNGVVSMFNYGTEYGKLLGCLASLQIAHLAIPPGVWTKQAHQGLSRKLEPKERSREAYERRWPGLDLRGTLRCKKPHEGLVDAILLAEYGRLKLSSSGIWAN